MPYRMVGKPTRRLESPFYVDAVHSILGHSLGTVRRPEWIDIATVPFLVTCRHRFDNVLPLVSQVGFLTDVFG
jgi:hypothetical protein